MPYDYERKIAVQAVLAACSLCREVQSTHLLQKMMEKRDGSPVTVADFGGQALVARHLKTTFPRDLLVGEEDSAQLLDPQNADLKKSVIHYVNRIFPEIQEKDILDAIDRGNAEGGPKGRFWVLDPVDGTKGFLRGDQYAVALALMEDGQIVLGVLGCPNLSLNLHKPEGPDGCLFVAVKGEGAYMRGLGESSERRIGVAGVERSSEALFVESVESSHSSHADSARVAETLGITNAPVRMDGQGKYGLIARGDATIYLRIPTEEMYLENIWDHAAGTVIVQEAGGMVTDIEGTPLDYTRGKQLTGNRGIIATNGVLHEAVLDAVRRALP